MNYLSNPKLRRAVYAIKHGEVIAYPTEGVWGLGCDPFNAHAVQRILELKQRPVEKGLILIAARAQQFAFLLDKLDPVSRARVLAPQQQATTWLVPHLNLVPSFISGNSRSVAIRISEHPVVRALSLAFEGPIVSTSANPAGLPSAVNAMRVRRYFADKVHIAPGRIGSNSGASRIIDAVSGERYR
ncbi:L-threonylcarbamoyladenylate synthase [Agaribacterium haliotis]|uniref:L-threonylcarbamoyladenylate synthase n=1 Tax=Agaribacterium haliotis TaxID=2013869 RepID=UPI000BB5574D|nr:Sua5/YciO/YrdC/YwlC family protein [Agaribacterium haliotis]